MTLKTRARSPNPNQVLIVTNVTPMKILHIRKHQGQCQWDSSILVVVVGGGGIIISLRKGAWQLVQANYKICSYELKFRLIVSIGQHPDYAFQPCMLGKFAILYAY